MGFHTYDVEQASNLEDPSRYEYLSAEELLALVAPTREETIADLGSGTGFYTDNIAPYANTVYAVDVQSDMHAFYREKGVPGNVSLVTADVADLPFEDGELDVAFSTMTYHEFASDDAFTELRRTIRPGGRIVIVDWTTAGEGTTGPPLDERYDLAHAVEHLREHGFDVEHAESRRETFIVTARRP